MVYPVGDSAMRTTWTDGVVVVALALAPVTIPLVVVGSLVASVVVLLGLLARFLAWRYCVMMEWVGQAVVVGVLRVLEFLDTPSNRHELREMVKAIRAPWVELVRWYHQDRPTLCGADCVVPVATACAWELVHNPVSPVLGDMDVVSGCVSDVQDEVIADVLADGEGCYPVAGLPTWLLNLRESDRQAKLAATELARMVDDGCPNVDDEERVADWRREAITRGSWTVSVAACSPVEVSEGDEDEMYPAVEAEDYSAWTYREVQAECKRLGLRAVGKRQELEARLDAYYATGGVV